MNRIGTTICFIIALFLSSAAQAGFIPVKQAGVVCSDMEAAFAQQIAADIFRGLSVRETAKMVSTRKSWCVVGSPHRMRPVQDTDTIAVGFEYGEGRILSYKTRRGKKMFFIEYRPWSIES